MSHLIGYLIGFDSFFILPALIILAFKKRMRVSTARALLIVFFVLMTAATFLSPAPIMIQAIAIIIAAVIYLIIYRSIRQSKSA